MSKIAEVRNAYNSIKAFAFLKEPNLVLSDYWAEETVSLEYMRSATDEILWRLRDHCHWITGIRSYEYKKHHHSKAGKLLRKLNTIMALDPSFPFYADPPHLGEFGFPWGNNLINLDTLRYFENLMALNKSGIISNLQSSEEPPIVCEIGAGWGGLIRQLWDSIPSAKVVLIDIPHVLLFSGTYLPTLFPEKKIVFFEPGELPKDFDLLFVRASEFKHLKLPKLDLVINTVSFQEMTSKQVEEYSQWSIHNKASILYSYNRDVGKYNNQLKSLKSSLSSWRHSHIVNLLPIDHTTFDIASPEMRGNRYRHQIFSSRKIHSL